MAAIIAGRVEGDLDVFLVHKLGAPGNPEAAIGAVTEFGDVMMSPEARKANLGEEYLRGEINKQLKTMAERRRAYGRSSVDPCARTVILVDDGIATGFTVSAALRALQAKQPSKLVVAVGVASSRALSLLRRTAEEIVCLHEAEDFSSVGEFFHDFSQVTDEDVLNALKGGSSGSRGVIP